MYFFSFYSSTQFTISYSLLFFHLAATYFAILEVMYSVVVPAFNEEKSIGSCLESLATQQTSHTFEVILVDNNSTDSTVDIASKFSHRLNIKIVQQSIRGRGAARKKGFDEATGAIIFSTDADTIYPPNWLDALAKKLTESSGVAVTGTCRITDCDRVTNRLFNFLQPQFMRIYRIIFGHYWLSGFNFAITRDAYQRSGGFREVFSAQEDVELARRVQKVGKIVFFSDLPVTFSGRRFKKGLLRGLLPYFSSFFGYFILKKHTLTLRDIR